MTQQIPRDTIYINELVIPCIIGVFDHERTSSQNVIVSLALTIDTRMAAKTDAIADSVSYHDIAHKVYEMVHTSSFHLLEKLAQAIADLCLHEKRIKQITVTIEKPKALRLAKSAAITITRTNE